MAARIQREGLVQNLYYFGINLIASSRRGLYNHPEFADSVDVNDEDFKRDYQHFNINNKIFFIKY